VFVFSAEQLKNDMHQRRQWTIYIANVAIEDIPSTQSPSKILENALVPTQRRIRGRIRRLNEQINSGKEYEKRRKKRQTAGENFVKHRA
jgi:hypothetical protein